MNGDVPEVFLAGGDLVSQGHTRRCLSAVESGEQLEEDEEEDEEEEEEEGKTQKRDGFHAVPLRRSGAFRAHGHNHSPFKRHSWGPGREHEDPLSRHELQAPGCTGAREAALLQSREELDNFLGPQSQGSQPAHAGQNCCHPSAGALDHSAPGVLSKSVSMSGISSLLGCSDPAGTLCQSSTAALSQSCSQLERGSGSWTGSPLQRTLSFLLGMTGKAKAREKEKMKEAKDARYTNGHLFTTISVSGMTMCYACNKSITAKEALICPTCNVTIHNRCKDTLANCTKVKQKQQKAALLKNNTALQSVSLRSKTTPRERPSSAIYPSDSFRQSLLGSRRGRSSLSLAKSVSTTNIAGHFNEESPLGLRRILSQSTDSLNMRNRTLSVESLIDEGAEVIYSELMSDFETDERDFAADSWSLAVDSGFLQQQKKEVMKQQDVIYELIQTELHHVRTLKIMTRLFRAGMLEELQLEPGVVQGLFPCVDELSDIHTRFLSQLLERRRQSLCPGSTRNFVIHRLGDLLINQFSGPSAEQMRKTYSEFCSRHTKALKLYKELCARDKRFQQFIRKVTRSAVLKRHGVQECILLVTQRVTKYPVLISRILQHSHGPEEERQDLTTALGLVKELLSNVDQDVHELEKGARLQEIYHRMDPRAQAPVPGKGPFGREELLRRRLIHDGCLLWKTATGRFKDVLMLLMTDVLLFLQEKDQKYIFPALDKPSVVSLQNLIVRDIANQEKGMFLISAAPPEMYEVHTASRDDRSTWIRVIQQSVRVCPSREDFPLIETEHEAYLRRIKMELQQKDQALVELLQEKVGLFAEMTHFQVDGDGGGLTLPTLPRGLFRSESLECPRGERLLQDAIREVEGLKDLLVGPGVELLLTAQEPALPGDLDSGGSTSPGVTANGEAGTFNGSTELCGTDSDSSRKDRNGNQLRAPQELSHPEAWALSPPSPLSSGSAAAIGQSLWASARPPGGRGAAGHADGGAVPRGPRAAGEAGARQLPGRGGRPRRARARQAGHRAGAPAATTRAAAGGAAALPAAGRGARHRGGQPGGAAPRERAGARAAGARGGGGPQAAGRAGPQRAAPGRGALGAQTAGPAAPQPPRGRRPVPELHAPAGPREAGPGQPRGAAAGQQRPGHGQRGGGGLPPVPAPQSARLHPNAGHPRRDRESRRGACGFRELRGPLIPSCAPRKNTPGEANSGASSVPSAREHWKELPTAPAGSGAPRTPGAAGKLGGNGPQHLLLVSRSYTTDASFSCLLPSTLGKFIYLLFISYTGSGEI
ncbi:rho guanine nucleotide exchange factor 2 isoform X3 [Mustela lutreola]|uniref:rho guanine nucleotide exchange factor 2 isoform X3 n=1 Tax=Mustela lutreola TaxID=9666 RepID=UPI0027977B39|nr:rho guanine nucleotide exchange factor 2 isoform X3 [Mustela lutreola]